MKVVLLETVGTLGNVGQVVNVKPGYARNFLFPQKKAVMADAKNVRQVEHQNRILVAKFERAKSTATKTKEALESQTLEFSRTSSDDEKLFGSVTVMDIQQSIEALGFVVSRKGIQLANPIKKVGEYQVPIKLDGDLEVTAKINVRADKSE